MQADAALPRREPDTENENPRAGGLSCAAPSPSPLAPDAAVRFNTRWSADRRREPACVRASATTLREEALLLRIIVIGKMKDRRLAALADDYVARIRPLAPVEVVELKDADPRREAAAMVSRLGARDPARPVLALDEKGEDLTTAAFAQILGAHGGLAFLVGGADGLGDEARARADRTLRLSSLTLTHEMARVLLLEQVYRGLSILRGLPYHRA